jgi:hypothetical protein
MFPQSTKLHAPLLRPSALLCASTFFALLLGCGGGESRVTSVAPAMTAEPADVTVNDGETVTFNAAAFGTPTPGLTWQRNIGGAWTAIPGATSTIYSFTAAASDNGARFRVVATNSAGNTTSREAVATVNFLALVTGPQDQTALVGGTATFTVTVSANPAPWYQWQHSTDNGSTWSGATVGTGATTASYTTAAATIANGGDLYRVVVTNGVGIPVTSAAARFIVTEAVAITSQPWNSTVEEPAAGNFTVTATGLPAPSYRWQRSYDGGATWADVSAGTGGTDATYSTGATSVADHGAKFRVIVSNGIGAAATSSVVTLAVNGAAAITTQPSSQTVTSPATATFTVVVAANPAPSYQWQRSEDGGLNWSDVATGTGGATAGYTTAATAASDDGALFRVIASNGVGAAATSATASLHVNVAPAITTQPVSATVVTPQAASFAVTATGIPAPIYQWQRSNDGGDTWGDVSAGTGGTTANYSTAATTPADDTAKFRVLVSNGIGDSVASSVVTLTANQAPSITTQPASQTVIAPAAATFTVVVSGHPVPTYQWRRSDDGGSTWSDVATGTGGATAGYTTAATAASDDGALFRVIASNGIGSAATSATARLNVNVAPVIITQPSDATVVTPQAASFAVTATGIPAPIYQWQRSNDGGNTWGDVSAGTGGTTANYSTAATTPADDGAKLRALVSNGIGDSVVSSVVTLTVDEAPSITTQPASQTVIAPAAATFTVVASGHPAPSYRWQRSDDSGANWSDVSTGTGGATASYTTAATAAADNGARFRMIASNGIGSVATSASASLNVNVAPAITSQPANRSVTLGNTATFTVVATGIPSLAYQWQRSNDGGANWTPLTGNGADTASYTTPATTLGDDGVWFRVTASNGVGSPSTSSVAVLSVVGVAPSIVQQPADRYVAVPQTATFTAAADGIPAPSFQWQRSNDGGTSWADISGATSASYATPATQPTDNGARFRALASNGVGSATTSAAQLTVNGPAPVIVTQPSNATAIAPATASFTVVATGEPALTFQWQRSLDGGTTWTNVTLGSGWSEATYTTPATSHADNATLYRVRVENSAGGPLASDAATLQVQLNAQALTASAQDNSNVDIASDSQGKVHLVYERNGRVLYRQGAGAEVDLGPGSFPLIAVGPNDQPQVAFISSGSVSFSWRSSAGWAPLAAVPTAVNVGWLGLDVGADNAAHLVIEASFDGDGYSEIYYTTSAAGSGVFSDLSLLADGWYYSGSGNYFHYPSIEVDPSGYWHIACYQQNWGGRVSWSSASIVLWTNDPAGTAYSAGDYPYNGLSLGRKAVTRDAAGAYHVVFNYNGTINRGRITSSGWMESTAMGTGSQTSISAAGGTVGIAYNNGSTSLVYVEDAGSGFAAPMPVSPGSTPALSLLPGGYVAIGFIDARAGVNQVVLWTDAPSP